MEKEKNTVFVSFATQKGGVGKSTFTIYAASWLHYVKGLNVAVVDCDYPQHSIMKQKKRDMEVVKTTPVYQNLLVEQSGMKNKAEFIFARIFGWEFKVVKIDKEAQEYYAQLTAFYQQFRRIGNNYNQCVKTIHTIYGEKKSLAFLYKLAEETRKLEEVCKQVIELTKRYEKEYLTKKE